MVEIIGGLDFPSENTRVKNVVYVQGWGFSKSNCDLLFEIYINGRIVDSGIGQFPRFDIFQKFKTQEAYTSGFIARVNLSQESDGPLLIEVKAKVEDTTKSIGKKNIIKVSTSNMEVKIPLPLGSVGPGIRKKNMGENALKLLIKLGGLQPSNNILDIGCGMGGVATPLTKYLSKGAKYEGLDISPTVINYCNEHINKKNSDFRFSLIDIYNKMYNPNGKHKGSNYKFPFNDQSFEFIFLSSVFTHLPFENTQNYLKEISRMLKHGAKCYMSFFLLNKEIENRINKGLSEFTFKNQFEGFRAENKVTPEKAIAYQDELIKNLLEDNDLMLNQIYYGQWSGNKSGITTQDIIVVTKK